MKTIQTIARIILCLLLLYGVYTETGYLTTFALFLIFVGSEIDIYLKRRNK